MVRELVPQRDMLQAEHRLRSGRIINNRQHDVRDDSHDAKNSSLVGVTQLSFPAIFERLGAQTQSMPDLFICISLLLSRVIDYINPEG